jgi:hypothetical protein
VKTLIIISLMLTALAAPAPAPAETCIGRVKIDVTTDNDGLNRKGDRVFNVGGCAFVSSALEKKVLHICPMGSWCRVVGPIAGDTDIESIDSVTRVQQPRKLTATPAQWKDIRTMSNAFLRCDNSEEYDPEIRKACNLSRKLQDKLAKQGFCTYGRILVGRPSKDEKDCDLLHNYPMHVLIP